MWNWEFFEAERSAHYFSTNMILGDSSTWYRWAASAGEIVIYKADTLFAGSNLHPPVQLHTPDDFVKTVTTAPVILSRT